MKDVEMLVTDHLKELRYRIIAILLPLTILAIIFYMNATKFIGILLLPLSKYGIYIAYFDITEGFVVKVKISVLAAAVILAPLIIYEIITFVGPGLTKQERKVIFPWLAFWGICFGGGVVIGAVGILPKVLNFFIGRDLSYLSAALSGNRYFNFLCMVSLVSGVLCSLPVILVLLWRLRVWNKLGNERRMLL